MGIAAASKTRYENAVKKLFPGGDYWEEQFADPGSDASLFAEAKAAELIRFKERMGALLDESKYETAIETVSDWERVFLNSVNNQLPLEERRRIINSKKQTSVNRTIISAVAQKHGLALVDIAFPFKTSFFGFSEFGRSIFSRPAFFSVIYIITVFRDEEIGNEAKKCVTKVLNRSSYGQGCFGTGQFLGRFYFNKNYAGRVFIGMKALDDFERDVNNILLSGNITYFLYKL